MVSRYRIFPLAVLTALGAFSGTGIALATMEADVWLWDGKYATINNTTSIYESEVLSAVQDYSTNGFSMPVLANPYLANRPCDGSQKLINFYETSLPLGVWPFYGAASAQRVWIDPQLGCTNVSCNDSFPEVNPTGHCDKSVRPNFGDVVINVTEMQWFPWPKFVTTHEPGHLIGRGHEIGDLWVYFFRFLDCTPTTIMFSHDCRERWIGNHGNTLFVDLQSSDVNWIHSNYP